MKLLEADRERERRAEAERMRTVRLDLQGSAADDEPRWRRPLYMDRYDHVVTLACMEHGVQTCVWM